jgi:RNA polymerase sigma-70 factor (ECF subfamily)
VVGAGEESGASVALSQTEFNRMVADHGPALYRMAYRQVGDRHEAEDVVQETFRSVWSSRRRYEPGRGERAWLVSILRRRAVDRWRKRIGPAVLSSELFPEVASANFDPLENGYTDEMQEALARLPRELRETLLLVVVGELTHQEASDELGVPLGTVLSRVSRARERLREYLLESNRMNDREDAKRTTAR